MVGFHHLLPSPYDLNYMYTKTTSLEVPYPVTSIWGNTAKTKS